MTKAPSASAFDDASSWVDSAGYTYTGDTTTADATKSAEDWKLRGAFLEGQLQAQTTIFQDMLAKLEAQNKRCGFLEGKVQAQTASFNDMQLAKLEAENKKLWEEKQDLVKRCGYLEGILEGKVQTQTYEVQERLAKLESENKELSGQKQQLASKADQVTASLDASREENKKLSEEVETLVQEQERAETEMKRLSTNAKTEINQLSAEKDELADKLQQITADLGVSREENKKLMEKVEKLVQAEEFQKEKAVWKSSQDKFAFRPGSIDVLNGPILHSGKTKWKIAVRTRSTNMCLGVVSAHETNFSSNWLGDTPGPWRYYCKGYAYYGGKSVGGQHYVYRHGSVVTFLLDLTGQGTLSVSVDGKPFVEVFGGMKSVATEFIPAVDVCGSGKVEFLGFE